MNKIAYPNNLIQKFLNHELTQEELVIFKKEWAENPEFVKEVQDYANLIIALKAVDRFDHVNIRKPSKIFSLYKHPVIAAIIVLSFLTIPAYFVMQSPSEKTLAQNYLIDYRLYPMRGNEINQKNKLAKALRAYNNQQIPKAIDLMKQVKDRKNDVYLFTLADLFLKANQPDSAIYYYQKGSIYNSTDPYAQWNSAMAWLQKGELKIAKEKLSQIILAKHAPYDQKAKALLKILKTPSFRIKALFY